MVLYYLDDFLVVGNGHSNVRTIATQLCQTLRAEGVVISPKSILEPVPELPWLAKHLILSVEDAGIFQLPRVLANIGRPLDSNCCVPIVPQEGATSGESFFMGSLSSTRCLPISCGMVVPHYMGVNISTFPPFEPALWLASLLSYGAQQGGGVSEKSDSVGGFEPPPPFFKNGPRGGFKGVFRRTHIICAIFFLVLFFWTAHPEFCPCPQFSHF